MNKRQGLVVLLTGLLVGACQSKNDHHAAHHHADSTTHTSGPVADLEKKILAVHDSVMPRMSDLMRLQKEVSAKLANADGSEKEKGLQISQQLKQADETMMDWMHQYKGDTLKELDQQQALDYLKIQEKKVNAMSSLMRKSLTDAEKYLKE